MRGAAILALAARLACAQDRPVDRYAAVERLRNFARDYGSREMRKRVHGMDNTAPCHITLAYPPRPSDCKWGANESIPAITGVFCSAAKSMVVFKNYRKYDASSAIRFEGNDRPQ